MELSCGPATTARSATGGPAAGAVCQASRRLGTKIGAAIPTDLKVVGHSFMTLRTWTIWRFRCGVLLRLNLSKYFTSLGQMYGILDPDGRGIYPSSVDLGTSALNDAERINGRLLQAPHELGDHRSAVYNR